MHGADLPGVREFCEKRVLAACLGVLAWWTRRWTGGSDLADKDTAVVVRAAQTISDRVAPWPVTGTACTSAKAARPHPRRAISSRIGCAT